VRLPAREEDDESKAGRDKRSSTASGTAASLEYPKVFDLAILVVVKD
jgi:hypothetical protein